jgi:hypothetical protein
MNCNKCGNKILDKAEFCNNCGAKIILEKKIKQRKPFIFPKQKTLLICLCFVVLCLFIFAVFELVDNGKLKSNNITLNKKIEDLNKTKEADYFKKKIDCEKYTDEIKKEINAENEGFHISDTYFEMLFYSPKENSCLYVVRNFTSYIENEKQKTEYFIYNVLTKSKITSFHYPDQWDDYKKFILEYSDGEIRL